MITFGAEKWRPFGESISQFEDESSQDDVMTRIRGQLDPCLPESVRPADGVKKAETLNCINIDLISHLTVRA